MTPDPAHNSSFLSPSATVAAPAELLAAALAVRDNAYVPYSHFRVGAALKTHAGQLIAGANVENASYGLAMCAERSALVAAVSQGVLPGDIAALLVVGDTPGPISPCGACRQVMLELGGPRLQVWMANLKGDVQLASAAELLPHAFVADDLSSAHQGRGAKP